MQHIFHHNSSGNSAFTNDLLSREVLRAISLHPVKQFKYQYRLHNFINQRKIIDLKQKSFLIEREIYELTKKILQNSSINTNEHTIQDRFKLAPKLIKIRKTTSSERRQNYDFDFFTRSLFASTYISPKRGLEGYWRNSLLDSVRQIMDEINRNSIERGRIIDFKDILYGYVRHHPLIGIDYIIDVLLVYRKYEGRKMTVPVRRHAYLRNSFTNLQFREDNLESSFYVDVPNEHRLTSNDTFNNNNNNNDNNGLVNKFLNLILPKGSNKNKINISNKKTDLKEEFQLKDSVKNKVINFIMPLTGRWQIFLRFMQNFEEICLKNNEYVTLVVVLFEKEGTEQTNLIQNLFVSFDKKYGDLTSIQLKLVVRKEAFSRSIGCEIGAAMFKENDLLFFVDVDIAFTRDFLFRARLNTIQYKQVYYPIVFSEYDPNDPIEALKHNSKEFKTEKQKQQDHFDFNENNGYWRQFGFGILLTYYSDLKQVGGFDTSIIGWGKEDVDLYEKYIKSNIFIFRSVDPGLTHVFHKIECDSKLSEEQMIMCLGSKATSIASQKVLSDLFIKTKAHLIIQPPFLNTTLIKD
jgi:chondroitin sulfate synthase